MLQIVRIVEQLTRAGLTTAESRVAQVVEEHPQLIAFGTMAVLVERAGVGAGTVARLCAKAGLDGFADLQRRVQTELVGALRPAAERIKEAPQADLQGKFVTSEVANVQRTLQGASPDSVRAIGLLLGDLKKHIVVAASDACMGVAMQFSNELSLLRPNVELLDGSPVAMGRRLALGDDTDVIVALDIRRYDKWLVETVNRFAAARATIIGLSDSATSPIAAVANHHFVIHAHSPGPFDSFTSALTLLNLLGATAAVKLRKTATDRLAKVEEAWVATGALQ
jgi:DNA-binding MurR/RpiR family transcriptional regulator